MSVPAAADPLGYEKLSRLLRKYAVPSIIAMVVSSLYNLVDQIFIGQGVGYLGNAATNVSFPFTTICMSLSLLLGVGSASRFSLELGAGRKENAAQTAGSAVCMMIGAGIIYAAVIQTFLYPLLKVFGATESVMPYAESYTRITALGMPLLIMINGICALARADGSPKYSMGCMLTGAVVNTVLDPIFIFGFGMGVAGAAAATVISQFCSFLIAVSYIGRFSHIRLERRHFRFIPSVCGKIAALGMSNCFNQIAITLMQIVLNNSLTHYGALSVYGSDIPLAGCGIVVKTNSILLGFIIGISQGSQPIVGFNYGAGKYERVRGVYRLAVLCNLAVSAAGFILYQFFPRQIIGIFGTGDPLYFEFAEKFMRIFLFMVLINGVQLISSNFFAAIGKPVKGVFLSLSRQIIFLIPLVLALPLFWGIDGILFAGPAADLMAFIITMGMVTGEFRLMKKADGLSAPLSEK